MANPTRPVTVGLIGCGQIAQERHLPALRSLTDAEIIAVADANPEHLKRVADRYHVPHHHRDHRALLDLPAVDAIAVLGASTAQQRVSHLEYHREDHLTTGDKIRQQYMDDSLLR